MKLTVDLNYEAADALLLCLLRQSIEHCCKDARTKEDRSYARRYKRAASLVIEHFSVPSALTETKRAQGSQANKA